MIDAFQDVLNPVGDVRAGAHPQVARGRTRAKHVIGLLDNTKPNVALFLETVESELRRSGDYEVVKIAKSRSAAPCAELDALAERCEWVINAVAD